MPPPEFAFTTSDDDDGAGAQYPCLFDKYEVGKLLGRGAFAKVYHGRDLRSGRNVAIKAVSKDKIVKGNLTAHVKREISIMRRLRHPNIVRLLEVLATKTKIYFVMEFAKGGELFAKVAKGRFSEDLSRRYFHQLVSAVQCCHSRGVYHRDLKPENLLLDDNWDLKVTDFGLSAVTDQVQADGLLHTLCGTPAYVAPEILAKKGYDGAKVDIWSCGVILYVLNAGYLPFNDTNLMVMYKEIYKGQFRCPKWTSPGLQALINRLLDPNPTTRITLDGITKDPWFKEYDGSHLNSSSYRDDFGGKCCYSYGSYQLNAFDIISFSSGFDLSRMLPSGGGGGEAVERFVSAAAPEKILERMEEAGKEEGMEVSRSECCSGMRLEGQDGNFRAEVEVYRLTEELVMVELKRKENGVTRDVWKRRFRPLTCQLAYGQPESEGVAGN